MSVALVVGGASGLGAAIAARLRDDGRTVETADLVPTPGGVVVDVTDAASVDALFELVARDDGRLDAFVYAPAVEIRAPIVETSDEDWQRVLDVNLKGAFLCLRRALPMLAASGGGSAVLLGSVLGSIGAPNYAAYCASKGALVNLAKQAAIEHAAEGVRVNVVAPSACDTGLFMEMARRAPEPERIIEMVTATNPMHRLGRAEEVAATVAFLCSDGAAFLSGAVVPLDGALAARRA